MTAPAPIVDMKQMYFVVGEVFESGVYFSSTAESYKLLKRAMKSQCLVYEGLFHGLLERVTNLVRNFLNECDLCSATHRIICFGLHRCKSKALFLSLQYMSQFEQGSPKFGMNLKE